MKREITVLIMGVVSLIYYSLLERGIPYIWGEEQENTPVHRPRKKETINEKEAFSNKSATPSYQCILSLLIFHSLCTWLPVMSTHNILVKNDHCIRCIKCTTEHAITRYCLEGMSTLSNSTQSESKNAERTQLDSTQRYKALCSRMHIWITYCMTLPTRKTRIETDLTTTTTIKLKLKD